MGLVNVLLSVVKARPGPCVCVRERERERAGAPWASTAFLFGVSQSFVLVLDKITLGTLALMERDRERGWRIERDTQRERRAGGMSLVFFYGVMEEV